MAVNSKKRAEWLIAQLNLEREMNLADIGARLTKEKPGYGLVMAVGAARLHAFEPEPEAFAEIEASKPERTTLYNAAVGKPGKATFYAHQIGSLSSVFKFSEACARYLNKGFWTKREVTEIPMTLVALDEVKGFPRLDFLKMDVQGAELDVMKGGEHTLSEAVMVVPEVRFYQMYEGEPTWAELDTELRRQGFVLHKFLHQKSVLLGSRRWKQFKPKSGSQLLDGDAVYIRNMEEPENMSDFQLKALAVMAETVAESHDLCAFCLTLLQDRGAIASHVLGHYMGRVPAEVLRAAEPKPESAPDAAATETEA
ncbi:FkbM family methyltransferase [Vannielia litorea]|uniref:Methyltransferase, FkbM family n=1 Tax=Vannielia litorea TaxID=1217970 RepID=A0A1N6F3W3_9RHOB|nr:FkbM family methyltransferase [Vannielia litorea]SIN89906.1 methyltransferase, FkbM family [Vannielia litorea]